MTQRATIQSSVQLTQRSSMKKYLMFIAAFAFMAFSCTKPDDTQSGTGTPEGEENTGGEETTTPKYKAGDYYKAGLAEGVIAWVDETGEHGLLFSLDEGRAAWATEYFGLLDHGYGLSTYDGQFNTKIIKSLENWSEIYLACAWCDSKNPLGLSSWYLPATEELGKALPALKEINATLESKGCPTIADGPTDFYWTSMELGSTLATAASFNPNVEADMYDCDKKKEHRVRAMRTF